MFKKIILILFLAIIVGAAGYFLLSGSMGNDDKLKLIKAEKGSIIDKALAVGQIEPRQEVSIKSKIPGIVGKIHVEIGDYVSVGDPLIDVTPDPTPIEFAEAKRQVEIYEVAYNNAKREFERARTLNEKQLISSQDFEDKQAAMDESELRMKLASEKFALIGSGKTKVANRDVDNTINSTVSGMVLSRQVEEGDPVVPLTSYQEGTGLMTLAQMEDLIFKGTVDEIDVGKLSEGMECEIKIGALPKDTAYGVLTKISPKARRNEGSTVFDVEIELSEIGTTLLRAGYSANADIIITRKEDILIIPERLIEFKEDTAFVELSADTTAVTIDTINIKTGLSDGINIEIINGLSEGDLLVERPPREL
jgi:HlyD family secretion protein